MQETHLRHSLVDLLGIKLNELRDTAGPYVRRTLWTSECVLDQGRDQLRIADSGTNGAQLQDGF